MTERADDDGQLCQAQLCPGDILITHQRRHRSMFIILVHVDLGFDLLSYTWSPLQQRAMEDMIPFQQRQAVPKRQAIVHLGLQCTSRVHGRSRRQTLSSFVVCSYQSAGWLPETPPRRFISDVIATFLFCASPSCAPSNERCGCIVGGSYLTGSASNSPVNVHKTNRFVPCLYVYIYTQACITDHLTAQGYVYETRLQMPERFSIRGPPFPRWMLVLFEYRG